MTKSTRRRRRITKKRKPRDTTSQEILGLHQLPDGPTYPFDAFREEGKPKRLLTLGANPNADIVLDADKSISWSQCLIERSEDGVQVIDCASTNGTELNGIAVQRGTLRLGSVLTLGETSLVAYGPEGVDARVSIVIASMYSVVHKAKGLHGTLRGAARALGIPPTTLGDWIEKKFATRNQPEKAKKAKKTRKTRKVARNKATL